MTLDDIIIKPIFYQNEHIWRDFMYLESACDEFVYNQKNTRSMKLKIMLTHEIEWKTEKNNFAFGAYDGMKMVGFANGYLLGANDMYLRNLYVNPDYIGMGIGSELLKKTESAASLQASYVSVVSLSKAVPFYEKHGYANFDNRNMLKQISKPNIAVVPVFNNSLSSLRVKNKTSYDKSVIKKSKHQPLFVYVNQENEIDGIGTITPQQEKIIWVNTKKPEYKNVYQRELSRALDRAR